MKEYSVAHGSGINFFFSNENLHVVPNVYNESEDFLKFADVL